MIGEDRLELCFEKLMVFGVEGGNQNRMEGGTGGTVINEWKDIPLELLLRILSLVDDDRVVIAVSGVCTGWRDAISWALTQLNLSWCKKNMNNLVISLAPKFNKLQVLNLRQDTPQLQDDAIEVIASYCRDLQDLDLSKSFKLGDRSLYALAHGCPNLTRLNISGCSSFSDNAVAYVARSCRKLKHLNLCGCVKAATDTALKAIGLYCNQLQSVNLGWCENITDTGVTSLANGCPNLRALDLCGCVLITDESVIALASNCRYLRSLGLYYCQNITDRAMYSLAQSQVKRKQTIWEPVKKNEYGEGLVNLNISQCTALTPPAVQAVCDSSPALHTCPGRHSLIISGCLSLTSVHCGCAWKAHRAFTAGPHPAH